MSHMPPPPPVVICVAPNGARKTYDDHPNIPLTPEQLASEALACAQAGATVMHVHVRDENLGHSLSVDRYRETFAHIKRNVQTPILLQATTESVGLYSAEQQMDLVKALRPPAASVALRELLPQPSKESEFQHFCQWAYQHEIALQFIVYTAQEATQLVELARRGSLHTDTPNTLFVLGRYSANQQSNPRELVPFLESWPRAWPWSVCAFGITETQCMTASIGLGGHVRVGFENNVHLATGAVAQSNADLVRNISELIKLSGRHIATPEEALTIYQATRFN